MGNQANVGGGKEAENTLNSRLVETLHRVGISTAEFERIFTIRKDGKEVASKPDVTFTNGGVHVLSAKWGERGELKAITSAWEYREDLEPSLKRAGEKLGEVFALTYPAARGEKFILHVLPRSGQHDVCVRLDSLEQVAQKIKSVVDGLLGELAREQEPVVEEAGRLLRWGARELADTLQGVSDLELEEIFGGHDFFESVLHASLKGKARHEALRLGAAYLFVNQVLFYVLLSQAAEHTGGNAATDYPPIKPKDFGSPQILRQDYFERVHAKNYEPIYGFNVARFFSADLASEACKDLVRGVSALAPKLDVPDLVGQVFQTLIPVEIRKPLGANYTNPRAAAVLAKLAVKSAHDSVLDPACGSGTLLVAAYRQKAALAGTGNSRSLHRTFLERDITGIEAMAFSGHLAAVNLALQQPLVETTHVRIGVADSTSKKPGSVVEPTETYLPREMKQGRLDREYTGETRRGRPRVVSMSEHAASPINLEKVDLVIMNPPFTSWHNMSDTYRDSLKASFSSQRAAYREVIHGKFSQQGFFLMLADLFLKEDGTLAAVLPFSTFSTVSYLDLVRMFLDTYSLKAIVVSFGRSAFSEDSAVTECLFVAKKGPPPPGHEFVFAGAQKLPGEWNQSDIERIVNACETGTPSEGLVRLVTVKQQDIRTGKETMVGLLHRLQPEFQRAQTLLDSTLSSSKVSLETWGGISTQKQLEVHRWVLGSELLSFYGPKALFISRNEQRAQNENDRLVFVRESEGSVLVRDRTTSREYTFPSRSVVPALRRFSYLTSFHVHGQTDFAVSEPTPELTTVMNDLYPPREAKSYLHRIEQTSKEFRGGRWVSRVNQGSATLNIGVRFDLTAPGTTILACRDDSPVFLAGYGFMIKGLTPREEKLFCLWTNSTLFLVQALSHMTATEGTWCKFEKSFVEQITFPDFDKIDTPTWTKLEEVYDSLKGEEWPSLLNQLKGHETRVRLDCAMLALVGCASPQSQLEIGARLREGVLSSLIALQGTMGK
jgi:hypothetical protein